MFKGFVSKKLSSIPRFWSSRLFSTVNNKSQIPLETIEDIDIKYEDEAYYLKKDLIKIEDEKIRLNQDYVGDEITEHQKREVDIILDRFIRLSAFESQHFVERIKHHSLNTMSTNPNKVHMYFPKDLLKSIYNTPDQHMNPNYLQLQSILTNLTPFIASGFFGGGQAAVAAQQDSGKKEVKEEQKEVKKEKATYDVQLFSFDPVKKIVLIKEVRAILNLGLKEAKDLVEKAPVLIKQNLKKEDIEVLKKKLEDNGGVVKLI